MNMRRLIKSKSDIVKILFTENALIFFAPGIPFCIYGPLPKSGPSVHHHYYDPNFMNCAITFNNAHLPCIIIREMESFGKFSHAFRMHYNIAA